MKHPTYTPNPIDTSSVELPQELTLLADDIARNVHEVWAKRRMAEGWTYGEERDDQQLQTPCMVPYDQLPDREKAYDHFTAMETLRLIVKFGFKIVKE